MDSPLVEDYLDHVCAPMVGKIPYERRQEIRSELTLHLESLVEAYLELGEMPDNAARLAMGRFGRPDALTRQMLQNEIQETPSVVPAFRLAFIVYGIIVTLMLMVEMFFRFANITYLSSNNDPSQAVSTSRMVLISIGRLLDFVYLPVFYTAFPIAAGVIVGLRASARQALGVFYGLTAWMVLLSFVCAMLAGFTDVSSPTGSNMLLSMQILLLPLTFIWLPFGCFAAALTDYAKKYAHWTRRFERFHPVSR